MPFSQSIGKDLLEDTFLHAIVRQCSSSSESIRKDCVSILYNLSKLEGSEAPLQRNGAVPALLGVALIRSRDAALRAKCVDTIHNIICEPGVRIKALKEVGNPWSSPTVSLELMLRCCAVPCCVVLNVGRVWCGD